MTSMPVDLARARTNNMGNAPNGEVRDPPMAMEQATLVAL